MLCRLALLLVACLLPLGCAPPASAPAAKTDPAAGGSDAKPLVERVLTREERDKLKPDEVLQMLKDGNGRFMAGTLTQRDHSKLVREASLGQFPKAVILSCLDSRIPVEDVFDRGIGDIFVARVAGNFANTDILGSMEFGCKVAGAKLILVMGHENCGAIGGAIDNVELGNITPMLQNIRPAVEFFEKEEGSKTSANGKFMQQVAEKNVLLTVAYIREHSPILSEMEENGQIRIVGAMYGMETGKVEFLKE
ncbi:carbonic anhydrase family protein [Lignipirellula cremea]|uniref:Carbonic anhydrase 2 n=1 Tax=Lignipirellula cremea TaxID=2528010 RepID=A0A518DNN2_9BACT|nr:carbonic anhydrase family protein [Lignipirellula cremea]QDU93449.1 Carbonic anhydrase 2 [Lignipirellula cremea]